MTMNYNQLSNLYPVTYSLNLQIRESEVTCVSRVAVGERRRPGHLVLDFTARRAMVVNWLGQNLYGVDGDVR